jgi:hypothetical protein
VARFAQVPVLENQSWRYGTTRLAGTTRRAEQAIGSVPPAVFRFRLGVS